MKFTLKPNNEILLSDNVIDKSCLITAWRRNVGTSNFRWELIRVLKNNLDDNEALEITLQSDMTSPYNRLVVGGDYLRGLVNDNYQLEVHFDVRSAIKEIAKVNHYV